MKKIIFILFFLPHTLIVMAKGWFDQPISAANVPTSVAGWILAVDTEMKKLKVAQRSVVGAEETEFDMAMILKTQQEKTYDYFTKLKGFAVVQQSLAVVECGEIIQQINNIYDKTRGKIKKIDPKMLLRGGNFYYLFSQSEDLIKNLAYIMEFVPSLNSGIKKNFLDTKEKNDIIKNAKETLLKIRENGYMMYRYVCILEMCSQTNYSVNYNWFKLSDNEVNRIVQDCISDFKKRR